MKWLVTNKVRLNSLSRSSRSTFSTFSASSSIVDDAAVSTVNEGGDDNDVDVDEVVASEAAATSGDTSPGGVPFGNDDDNPSPDDDAFGGEPFAGVVDALSLPSLPSLLLDGGGDADG
jgi:hypothetical protein